MARQADGTIYINTEIDGAGFKSGIDSMQGGLGKLTKSVKRLGTAIGSVFAIKELVQFSKEAIELGSDLQEVQNVVDVTFTTLSKEVDNFARAAAKTAGLSETMAKRYAGTFGSMAKAFGFAEENALEMATALTQLSGDIASFYNITQDEAYTKLKSIFTGETESLKDLGVVMSQTALDSFAMQKGIGKVTSKMTEQEKVALRYQFVLEQLSLASGDFQRTSDGWANQMRVMNLNIESLKANIGQGLINLFTPIAIIINDIIEKISVLGTKFKEFTEIITNKKQQKDTDNSSKSISSLGKNYEKSAENVDDFSKALNKANKETKKGLSPLDNLNNLTSSIAENLLDASTGNILLPENQNANFSIDIQGEEKVSKISDFLTKVASSFGKLKDKIVEVYDEHIKPFVQDFIGDINQLGGAFVSWFSEKIIPIINEFAEDALKAFNEDFGPTVKEIVDWLNRSWNEILMPFFEWLGEMLGVFLPPYFEKTFDRVLNIFSGLKTMIDDSMGYLNGLIDFITGVFTGNWEQAWNGVKEIFAGIINNWINIFQFFINSIIDGLNAIISGANALGSHVGVDIVIPTVPKFDIPKLATGAVIPPNAPFMAMLGDQKNGTNIEAPLDTIKQGLAEVLAEMGINVTFEVNGDEAGIFNVTQRQARMFTKQTGKPAFPTGG